MCKNICKWKKRTDNFSHYLRGVGSYYNIPGLLNTNIAGENCEDMVPQGICQMGDYTIISAYCYKHGHKPVLYAVKYGNVVATLVLPYSNYMHAGGIAFDGTYLWIANGQTNYGESARFGDESKRMYYIKKNVLEKAISSCEKEKSKSFTLPVSCANQYVSLLYDPAFCTFFEGYLWCGKFSSTGVDMMYEYKIDKSIDNSPKLINVGDMQVPRATQGITFYRYNKEVYLITSNSWKRKPNGSKDKKFEHSLIVYKPYDYDSENKKGGNSRDFHKGGRVCDITIPYMSEQISEKSSSLFVIFESYANEYRDAVEGNNLCSKYCLLDFYKVCVE